MNNKLENNIEYNIAIDIASQELYSYLDSTGKYDDLPKIFYVDKINYDMYKRNITTKRRKN